jgi:arylsulfatase A-like enzyme
MLRRSFLQSLASLAGKRPNVILVLADDLGYGDLGCYGQRRIRTPQIDQFAREGTRFTQAYAGATVCAPSRCSLFTGLDGGHARIRGNKDVWLQPEDQTMSQMLKSAGYQTGLFGKWSLGGIGTNGHPNAKGFDEFFGYFSQMQAHLYYPEVLLHNRREVALTGNWGTARKQWAHDVINQRAFDWIEKTTGPFFAHLAWTIPHANNELGRVTGNGMEVPSDKPYSREPWPQVERNFAAMVTRMDKSVGELMTLLKRRGLDDNTLVLFASDNGPHKEGGHDADFFESRGPLRGIKRDLYEGGIRVPMIARWPGHVPSGKTSDFVWAFWDLMPTLGELCGAKIPAGLNGQSVAPALEGRSQQEHEFLYWEFHEGGFWQAARHKNWKGVRKGLKGKLELYDLATDIGERNDVSAAHPDVVRQIEAFLAGARTDNADFPVT